MASIFSKILNGDIPGHIVHEEEHWVVLLDLFPVEGGHLLLVPRHETPHVAALDDASLSSMGPLIARASAALKTGIGCPAVSILIRDGEEAGQEIPHVHVHLVPRFTREHANRYTPGSYGSSDDERQTAMAAMAARLSTAF